MALPLHILQILKDLGNTRNNIAVSIWGPVMLFPKYDMITENKVLKFLKFPKILGTVVNTLSLWILEVIKYVSQI